MPRHRRPAVAHCLTRGCFRFTWGRPAPHRRGWLFTRHGETFCPRHA